MESLNWTRFFFRLTWIISIVLPLFILLANGFGEHPLYELLFAFQCFLGIWLIYGILRIARFICRKFILVGLKKVGKWLLDGLKEN